MFAVTVRYCCLNRGVSDEYTLDQLAAATGISSRTIRFYQAEKLMAKPRKRGRDAIYDTTHVERLTQVGELRDRGLKLDMIRTLVTSADPAETIGEWLGVDATLSAPWSSDRPQHTTKDELTELIGHYGSPPVGLIGELDRHGYIVSQADGNWTIPSPALLGAAVRLYFAGTDIDVTARVHRLFRRRISRAVDDAVDVLTARIGNGFAGSGSARDVALVIDALRPAAYDSVSAILANEVERALTALLEAGPDAIG